MRLSVALATRIIELEWFDPLMLTIRNLHGLPLDATCSIHETPRGCEITFECRGGARGTPQARNLDYMAGLESVLQRLAMARCILTDAFLDTRLTKRLGLGREQARLNMPTFPYPVCLTSAVDLLSLRNEMCAAQRPVGRGANAKGAGNNTKRFTMVIEWLGDKPLSDLSAFAQGAAPSEAHTDHCASPVEPSMSNQGRGLSARDRQAVEKRAMEVAARFLCREWQTVEDISLRESCDLHCVRGSEELWVEVKGTTGALGKVLLTRNEVHFARQRYPNTALVVVHGIELVVHGDMSEARGGRLALERPWYPSEDRLAATQFEYALGSATAVDKDD